MIIPSNDDGLPRKKRIRWRSATRIIASRYPPIQLFERVSSDPSVWEALIAAEELVNPRVRDEIGEIALVPPEDRISGPNASYVMASFTHINPRGSRFSDGRYGVYYAAREFLTAFKETVYHFERFARDSDDGIRREDMRVLVGTIDAEFHDIESLPEATQESLLDPESYIAAQAFGNAIKERGSNGIVYPSVRNQGGRCVGAFRPKAVRPPIQERHLCYFFDGDRVSAWFDYSTEVWEDL